MEKFFHLKENGTTVKTEVHRRYHHLPCNGVHPGREPQHAGRGRYEQQQGVFTATALSAGVQPRIIMALLCQLPHRSGFRHGPERLLCLYHRFAARLARTGH